MVKFTKRKILCTKNSLVPREWRKLHDEEFSLLNNVKWKSDGLYSPMSGRYKVHFLNCYQKRLL